MKIPKLSSILAVLILIYCIIITIYTIGILDHHDDRGTSFAILSGSSLIAFAIIYCKKHE